MGMHFGILAADMSWPELLVHLEKQTGKFIDQGPILDSDQADLSPKDEGFPLLAGEYGNGSYVLDTSFLLSGMIPDFVARLASESGNLLVGCGAETVSGSYYLVVVRGGHIIRHYYSCHSEMSRPYSAGNPLPTEIEYPLDDLDGIGLRRSLNHFGFDFDGWYSSGMRRSVLYTYDKPWDEKGPLQAALDEHMKQFELPPDEVPPLRVVAKDVMTGEILSKANCARKIQTGNRRGKQNWIRRLCRKIFSAKQRKQE